MKDHMSFHKVLKWLDTHLNEYGGDVGRKLKRFEKECKDLGIEVGDKSLMELKLERREKLKEGGL